MQHFYVMRWFYAYQKNNSEEVQIDINALLRHAKIHDFYTNKFNAKIILPKKCVNYDEKFILDKQRKRPKRPK